MRKLALMLLVLWPAVMLGQEVKVINNVTLQAVENVLIYNLDESSSTLTNLKGKADLDVFEESDTLVFQHTGFVEYIIPLKQLGKLSYVVRLSEKSVNLGEVVIAASKWEQNRAEVPNKISAITSREIDFQNPQTAADLIGLTKEVFIQKSQYGGGSPMIRGFAANSILIVVDGVRMNNAIFRSGNLQNVINIDPSIIQSAEVIFGPGSLIYGSDALGGVMDFHTEDVKLGNGDEAYVKTNALFRYATASSERTAHIDFNYGAENWGSFTSISMSDFDDLRMGDNFNAEFQRKYYAERIDGRDTMLKNDDPNIQKFSGYRQLNLMQKFRYRPGEHLDIRYNIIYSTTSDIPRYDRLIEYKGDQLKYADWYYGPQDWMMHNLQVELDKETSLYNSARLTAAYQHFEESRHDRKFDDLWLRSRTEKVDAISLNLDFDKKTSEKNTIFYGVEGVFNKVNSTAQEKNILDEAIEKTSTRYPDGGSDYYTLSAYASNKLNLSNQITLTAGLRYSQVIAHSEFEDTTFFKFPFQEIKLNTGAFTGSLGMVYRPGKSWQFNLNASSGFRAPNIDDLAKVFDSEPGNVIVPNDDLSSEYAYNIDFGIVKRFGDNAKVDLTVFYTYLDNAMARRKATFNGQDSIEYDGSMSQVWKIVNVGHANIYGGSLTFNFDVSDHISFDTYLTYQKGEDSDGLPVRHVSPLFGSTGLTLTKSKFKVKFNCIYNGKVSYEELAESERNKPHLYAENAAGNPYSPSWWTFNIKTSYQLNENIRLEIGYENFFDYRYRPYSSGIAAPGRNLILSLRGSF